MNKTRNNNQFSSAPINDAKPLRSKHECNIQVGYKDNTVFSCVDNSLRTLNINRTNYDSKSKGAKQPFQSYLMNSSIKFSEN